MVFLWHLLDVRRGSRTVLYDWWHAFKRHNTCFAAVTDHSTRFCTTHSKWVDRPLYTSVILYKWTGQEGCRNLSSILKVHHTNTFSYFSSSSVLVKQRLSQKLRLWDANEISCRIILTINIALQRKTKPHANRQIITFFNLELFNMIQDNFHTCHKYNIYLW